MAMLNKDLKDSGWSLPYPMFLDEFLGRIV